MEGFDLCVSDQKMLVHFERVSKSFSGLKALDDITFSIKSGSIHVLLGPNGAGKTTTMNLIAGLTAIDSGKVYFNDVEINSNVNYLEGKVGYLSEQPPLYNEMTVVTYLEFVAKVFEVKYKNAVNETIEKCKLENVRNRIIGQLSRGYKQRVAIAQSIVYSPELVIFDEPTLGLDPETVFELRSIIKGLKENHTVLVSTHQLLEAEQICTELSILNSGKIIQTGQLKDLKNVFQGTQSIRVKVQDKNNIDYQSLERDLECRVEEINRFDSERDLRFVFNVKDDKRHSITNHLVSKNIGVLEIKREEMNLEDIFREVTSKGAI